MPALKKAAKKVHGGKRPGQGRKKENVYRPELGKLQGVAFQVPKKKVDEFKKIAKQVLAGYKVLPDKKE